MGKLYSSHLVIPIKSMSLLVLEYFTQPALLPLVVSDSHLKKNIGTELNGFSWHTEYS